MGYTRYGIVAGSTVDQPAKVTRTDVYGNTYENFCGDYEPHNVENTIPPTTTFKCVDYDYISSDGEEWIARYVDNSVRIPEKYIHTITISDEFIPTVDNPLLADEDDLTIEISDGQFTYSLYSESNIPIRFEENTDIVFKGVNDIIATEDLLNTIQTNDGRDLSVE